MLGHDAVGLKAQWLGDMFVQELAKSLADGWYLYLYAGSLG